MKGDINISPLKRNSNFCENQHLVRHYNNNNSTMNHESSIVETSCFNNKSPTKTFINYSPS